jgi:hypothetical protein
MLARHTLQLSLGALPHAWLRPPPPPQVSVIHANFVTNDATSHWLMGVQLIATYTCAAAEPGAGLLGACKALQPAAARAPLAAPDQPVLLLLMPQVDSHHIPLQDHLTDRQGAGASHILSAALAQPLAVGCLGTAGAAMGGF